MRLVICAVLVSCGSNAPRASEPVPSAPSEVEPDRRPIAQETTDDGRPIVHGDWVPWCSTHSDGIAGVCGMDLPECSKRRGATEQYSECRPTLAAACFWAKHTVSEMVTTVCAPTISQCDILMASLTPDFTTRPPMRCAVYRARPAHDASP